MKLKEKIDKLSCGYCVRIYGEPCHKHDARCIHAAWLSKEILKLIEENKWKSVLNEITDKKM